MSFLGPLISAGSSLLGGWLSSRGAAAQNAQTAAHNAGQMAQQREFAQEGIRWRVKDALAAGIHPLYALGAQTPSYTPTSAAFVNESAGLASSLQSAGQDIGRAVNATRTLPERADAFTKSMQVLQVKNAELDTQIKQTQLASNIQRLKQNSNPPFPGGVVPEETKPDERKLLSVGGNRWMTTPGNSPGEAYEAQYQDIGNIFAVKNLYDDYWRNMGSQGKAPPSLWEIMKHVYGRADAAIRAAPLY